MDIWTAKFFTFVIQIDATRNVKVTFLRNNSNSLSFWLPPTKSQPTRNFFQIPQLVHPKTNTLGIYLQKTNINQLFINHVFSLPSINHRAFFKLGFPGHWDRFLSIGIQVHDLKQPTTSKVSTFFPAWKHEDFSNRSQLQHSKHNSLPTLELYLFFPFCRNDVTFPILLN